LRRYRGRMVTSCFRRMGRVFAAHRCGTVVSVGGPRRLGPPYALVAVLTVCVGISVARPPVVPELTRYDPKPTELGDRSAEVLAVAYAPARETLATGGADKLVRLWDLAAGKLVATLDGHADAVAGLAFSPDGKTLASASYDKTVKLWDVPTRTLRQTLTGHKN